MKMKRPDVGMSTVAAPNSVAAMLVSVGVAVKLGAIVAVGEGEGVGVRVDGGL